MANDPDEFTKTVYTAAGDRGIASATLGLAQAEAQRRREAAGGDVTPAATKPEPGLLDRAKSFFGWNTKPEPAAAAPVIPKQPQLSKSPIEMAMFSGVDNVKGREFSVKTDGHAPPPPLINDNNTTSQISYIFRNWLSRTDTLPAEYADKFLREPDNNRVLRDKISAMFEKQEDPDARAYGKEFLQSMDKVRDHYISASINETQNNQSLTATPGLAPPKP